jgi:hypothetical protein
LTAVIPDFITGKPFHVGCSDASVSSNNAAAEVYFRIGVSVVKKSGRDGQPNAASNLDKG